ncbi:MAG: hypothetical protein CNLJKLNK_00907 [Holosporales bacterium]
MKIGCIILFCMFMFQNINAANNGCTLIRYGLPSCAEHIKYERIEKIEIPEASLKEACHDKILKTVREYFFPEKDSESKEPRIKTEEKETGEPDAQKETRVPVRDEELELPRFKYAAYVDAKIGEEKWSGSGVLVGPGHVLTAAHVIYGEKGLVDEVSVSLALNGKVCTFGTQKVNHVFLFKELVERDENGVDSSEKYDLALLVLDDYIGNKIGWLDMDFLNLETTDDLYLAGYPGSVQPEENADDAIKKEAEKLSSTYRKIWHGTVKINKMAQKDGILSYIGKTSKGMSGCEIVIITGDERKIKVVGVHTKPGQGVPISEDFLIKLNEAIKSTGTFSKSKNYIFLSAQSVLRSIYNEIVESLELKMVENLDDYYSTYLYTEMVLPNIEEASHTFVIEDIGEWNGDEKTEILKYFKMQAENKIFMYFLEGDIAKRAKFEELIKKPNKHLEEIVYLMGNGFSLDQKSFFAIANRLKKEGKLSDAEYLIHLTNLQMGILYLTGELLNIQFIQTYEYTKKFFTDSKREIKQKLNKNYLVGRLFLDKAHRFWRDDHKNVGTSCVTIGSVPTLSNNQDRYLLNQAQSYLTALYTAVHANKEEQSVTVIHGAGGMGKSTLAAQYVKEAKENKAYDLVVWINAENEETLKNSLLNVIRKIETKKRELNPNYVPSSKIDNSSSIIEMKEHLEAIIYIFIHAPLFIFDNAPGYRTAGRAAEGEPLYNDVAPYLPNVGHVIVTTQMNPGDLQSAVRVGCFSVPEAVSYVKKRLKMVDDSKLEQVKALVQKLDCHPLALSIACGYILDDDFDESLEHDSWVVDIDSFLSQYDNQFRAFATYQENDDMRKSLYTMLHMSLGKLSDEQKDLFFKLCFLQPDSIPSEIIKNGASFRKLCLSLSKKNLIDLTITPSKDIKFISLHRLTQDVGRYIFEHTEEFSGNKQAFFQELQGQLESYVLNVHKELEAHKSGSKKLTQQDLEDRHKILSDLKLSWYALIKNAPKDILLIDKNAYFVRILHNRVADALLELDAPHDENFLKKHLNVPEDQFQTLTTLYQQHFSHLDDPIHKKQIMIKLSKFFDDNFTKTIDWSFFDALPFEETSKRLDVLISSTEDQNFDLVNFFEQSKKQIETFASDPYLTLVAVRFHQKRAGNTPYVFNEAIQFLAQLCTKSIECRNVKLYEYALSLWAKLSPHHCALLSKLQNYDENTVLALLNFSDVRLINSLNGYINFAINFLDAIKDGEESATVVNAFPAFIQMQRKIMGSFCFSDEELEDDNFILSILQQFPSFKDVMTDIYVTFVRQNILPKEEYMNVSTAIRLIFKKIGINTPNLICQAYENHMINFMAELLQNQLSNPAHTFFGLLKFFPYAIKEIGIGNSHDGKDDYFLLETYSKIRATQPCDDRLKIIQEKALECFGQEQLDALKVHELYKIYFIVHKIYQTAEQFDALWQKFNCTDTTHFTAYERAQILEWHYDVGDVSPFMEKYLSLFLELGFTLGDALDVLRSYQESSVEFSDKLYDRFLKINPFPTSMTEKLTLAKYLPHVCDERFQTILDHPILQSSLSNVPIGDLVAMAATMDTAQSQKWLDENESYKSEKSLWNQWIENTYNADFYGSYMVHIARPS